MKILIKVKCDNCEIIWKFQKGYDSKKDCELCPNCNSNSFVFIENAQNKEKDRKILLG